MHVLQQNQALDAEHFLRWDMEYSASVQINESKTSTFQLC